MRPVAHWCSRPPAFARWRKVSALPMRRISPAAFERKPDSGPETIGVANATSLARRLAYQYRPEIVDIGARRSGDKQISQPFECREAVVSREQPASVQSGYAQAADCRAIGKGAGVGFRSIDAIGICGKRGDIQAIDGQAESECKLAVATAASSPVAHGHGCFSAEEYNSRPGEWPVAKDHLPRNGCMHPSD